jgi:uncharacterized membrane protein YraQ (UPF0718 family)
LLSLILSIVALALGPALYRLFRRQEGALAALDGFMFVSMGGLILLILPETVDHGGWRSLVFVLMGLLGPSLLERNFHRLGQGAHWVALLLGLIGLCLHAVVDGMALGETPGAHEHGHGHGHGDSFLPLAVMLHRIPVGLTIWWLLRRTLGKGIAISILALMAISTVVGFFLGVHLLDSFTGQGMAWFKALVAGSLLHVVFHRPHKDVETHAHGLSEAPGWCAGLGGLLGCALFAFLVGWDGAPAEADKGSLVTTFLSLALASAPALLIAYVLAGFLGVFLPGSSIRWLGRGPVWNQAIRGVALGLPLPVCSCGVVPLYRALVQRGAPTTSAMAFLVATPEIGLDAVLLSIPLLGGPFAGLRVVAAALLALLIGIVVGRLAKPLASTAAEMTVDAPATASFATRVREGLKLGLGEVVDHTGPWILLGLGVAAAAAPLVEESWLTETAPSLQVMLFAVVGVPAYVCASGATPLVAVLLFGGVSPGAALAFLLTGPATNITTFGVLAKLHGRFVAVAFSLVMVTASVGLGLVANWVFHDFKPHGVETLHDHSGSTFQQVCLVLLTLVLLASFFRRGPRRFVGVLFNSDDDTSHGAADGSDDGHDHSHGHG